MDLLDDCMMLYKEERLSRESSANSLDTIDRINLFETPIEAQSPRQSVQLNEE